MPAPLSNHQTITASAISRATVSWIRPDFVVAFAPMNTLTMRKPKAKSEANDDTQSTQDMARAYAFKCGARSFACAKRTAARTRALYVESASSPKPT